MVWTFCWWCKSNDDGDGSGDVGDMVMIVMAAMTVVVDGSGSGGCRGQEIVHRGGRDGGEEEGDKKRI